MATHQKASVEIVNQSGHKLLSVKIIHKYSDIASYTKQLDWTSIPNGAKSSNAQEVDYNTGAFTTGRDWWEVTWVNDLGEVYLTDPHNFRNLLDFGEKIGKFLSAPAMAIGSKVAITSPEPTSKTIGGAVAATGFIAELLLNSGTTDGYKQHILRSEDTKVTTQVIIKGNEVEFKSKSGSSHTGFRKVHTFPLPY